MTEAAQSEAKLREYLRRATVGLQEERRRVRELTDGLAELESRPAVGPDAVAVIGMGCRWPGGIDTPDALWRALLEGRDCLSPFPTDRGWDVDGLYDPEPGVPGRCCVREGGFLADASAFDAAFFGYTADESAGTDPQQRLLLHTAWEAVESAGIDPLSLGGSATGVFVGLTPQGYAGSDGGRERPEEGTDYLAVGTLPSAASGRISYFLGLHGPALTVDTACSSSLSALHLARQALLTGECSLTLAAGVTVIAVPDVFLEHSRLSALARDGRTKPFSAKADGGNWAEGVGVLLLERLSDAERLGHPVLAVVRGSAVGQNGTSNGLAVPNGPGQQRVMERALADAGLKSADVDFVEAHGTGTPLGDVMEAEAMLRVYGPDRDAERPLLFGSVKSNFGHTQSASGMAGVMKTVLALTHGTVPATLNCEPPVDTVERSHGALRAVPESVPWPETDRPRRAAVTALGAGGTNGHVIVEQPERPAWSRASAPSDLGAPAVPWILSAKDPEALRGQARKLLAHLDGHQEQSDLDVAYSLAVTRSAFPHRAAVVGDRTQLLSGLRALADGETSGPALMTGRARTAKAALVCSAPPVARLASDRLPWEWPVFTTVVAGIEEELRPFVSVPPTGVLRSRGDEVPSAVESFALSVAVARLWRRFGVRPAVILGQDGPSRWAAAHLRRACTWEAALEGLIAGRDPSADLSPASSTAGLIPLPPIGPPDDERSLLARQLAEAFVAGVRLDWAEVYAGLGAVRVPLPTYAFRNDRHWSVA
ncbi:type I polyketide synthase [Streptomyces sp. 351MFTsu5.1]|uniref:type I polyketide synthase n=1 Tax=Streptomyces sp. 351MFTsu5.1 TaxID=1172180 RepID=UPI00037FB349|nr:beta-ketoacyl synthase N-terminal-like domain-containing protein [Streptomyces sp. 351MFTsu5.1]